MGGEQRQLTFRLLSQPNHVDCGGRLHGGVVIEWIDRVGYAGTRSS